MNEKERLSKKVRYLLMAVLKFGYMLEQLSIRRYRSSSRGEVKIRPVQPISRKD
jgi:hypothetical protein